MNKKEFIDFIVKKKSIDKEVFKKSLQIGDFPQAFGILRKISDRGEIKSLLESESIVDIKFSSDQILGNYINFFNDSSLKSETQKFVNDLVEAKIFSTSYSNNTYSVNKKTEEVFPNQSSSLSYKNADINSDRYKNREIATIDKTEIEFNHNNDSKEKNNFSKVKEVRDKVIDHKDKKENKDNWSFISKLKSVIDADDYPNDDFDDLDYESNDIDVKAENPSRYKKATMTKNSTKAKKIISKSEYNEISKRKNIKRGKLTFLDKFLSNLNAIEIDDSQMLENIKRDSFAVKLKNNIMNGRNSNQSKQKFDSLSQIDVITKKNSDLQEGKYRIQNYNQVIDDLTKAISIEPKNEKYLFKRGEINNELENFDEAINDFTKALELNKQNPENYSNRGLAKFQLKKYQAAINDFTKALVLNKQNPENYSKRGLAKFQLKKYQAAINDLKVSICINPLESEYFYTLGKIKEQLKIFSEALDHYDEAIRLNPNYATYFYKRGVTKTILKKYSLAIDDFDKAINLEPTNASFLFERGNAIYKLSNLNLKKDNKKPLKPRYKNESISIH